MRAFLQGGLHHNVALHADLELRYLGWDAAVIRWPQCPQELSLSDRVHYDSPVLTHRDQQERVSKDTPLLLSGFLHFNVGLFFLFFFFQYISTMQTWLVNHRQIELVHLSFSQHLRQKHLVTRELKQIDVKPLRLQRDMAQIKLWFACGLFCYRMFAG